MIDDIGEVQTIFPYGLHKKAALESVILLFCCEVPYSHGVAHPLPILAELKLTLHYSNRQ
jgi:hypothetical protein